MRTLIVYDSFFGNTEQIAHAIGNSIDSTDNVEITRVTDIKPEQLIGLDLLIVGSPTRAFRPTKPIVNFLNSFPANDLRGVKVAAFDTRISAKDVNSRFLNGMVKVFGYAAEPIGRLLTKKGGDQLVKPEGFFVKDTEGPLKEGELERASNWIKAGVS